MVFSSLPFLFLLLPVTLFVHSVLPFRFKNIFLLLINLVFYGYGEPVYNLLMLASVAINYGAGLLMEKCSAGWKKGLLVLAVIVNLSALGWYKYAVLLTQTLRLIPFMRWLPEVSVALPIGISFYTFQAMSYVIDVYRRDCDATTSFVDFAAYISLFPQLIAGPIVRYSDVALQLKSRSCDAIQFSIGVRLFVIGLAKKVLLANQFALLWEAVQADPAASGTLAAWMGIMAYTLQIYFDFGGYSDMARGLGAMLGFDFCINFNYPYLSKSVTEFWRRWHISLSTWFRDYVYFPLGGSRKGSARTAINLMIVWMLTGFWHGAGWNFLFWGFYYGVLLLIEKFLLQKNLERIPGCLRWLGTMLLVMIGWVFFASENLTAAWNYLSVMFWFRAGVDTVSLIGWLPMLIGGVLAATPVGSKLWKRWDGTIFASCAELVLCLAALLVCTASIVSGSYNPFLYFRF